MKTILVAAFMLATATAHAGNMAECILDKMPGTSNQPAALAVYRLCAAENFFQYMNVAKGSGRGVFGFKNSESCIIKRGRDTVQPNAAAMIAVACRCLYDEPFFEGEMCAYPPGPWDQYK